MNFYFKSTVISIGFMLTYFQVISQVPTQDFEQDLKSSAWRSSRPLEDSMIFQESILLMTRCGEVDSCYTPMIWISKGKFMIQHTDHNAKAYVYRYHKAKRILILYKEDDIKVILSAYTISYTDSGTGIILKKRRL